MMRLILFIVVAMPLVAMAGTRTARDQTTFDLLRAVEYGKLQRIVITRECKSKPILAKVPACTTIYDVTDDEISSLAVPFMNSYVSERHAQAALRFWTSSLGSTISKKLIAANASNSYPDFTAVEVEALENFNNSDEGKAMSAMAIDRQTSVSIIRAIGSIRNFKAQ